MTWYYEPDDITDEQELRLLCKCGSCDYEEDQDVYAEVGKRTTTWSWKCHDCGYENDDELENSKIFDNE